MFLAAALLGAFCQALNAQAAGSWIKADSVNTSWYNMKSLLCSDSMNCISLSSSHGSTCCTLVRFTSDGGVTWQDVYNDSIVEVNGIETLPEAGNSIAFPEPGFAVVCHDSGLVSISCDTMKTWTKFETARNSMKRYTMYDKNNGFKFVFYYKFWKFGLEYTSDGGASWKNIEIPVEYRKNYIIQSLPVATDVLMLLCEDEEKGYIIVKVNAGKGSWNYVQCPKYSKKMFFHDSLSGWVAVNQTKEGDLHYVVATTDGGRNWGIVIDTLMHLKQFISDVYFLDKNNGIVTGYNYTLIRTYDGGSTWQQDQLMDIPIENQSKAPINLYQVGFLSYNSGLIRGENNVIYRYTKKPVSVSELVVQPAHIQPEVNHNPAKIDEISNIKIKLPEGIEIERAIISIFNYNGALVEKKDWISNESGSEISFEHLDIKATRGVYFIRIEAAYNIWHVPIIFY